MSIYNQNKYSQDFIIKKTNKIYDRKSITWSLQFRKDTRNNHCFGRFLAVETPIKMNPVVTVPYRRALQLSC